MNDVFILFDNSLDPDKDSLLLSEPVHEIKASSLDQVRTALQEVESYQNKNYYLGGYLSYECAYPLFNLDSEASSKTPFLWFYAFAKADPLTDNEVRDFLTSKKTDPSPTSLTSFKLLESFGTYKEKLQKIKQYQHKGDTYQVNYTLASEVSYSGDLYGLYLELREHQPVEYGAFINFPELNVLSFSPELFFKKQQNQISSKPMKGTMARSDNPDTDQKIVQQMRQDDKIISENLMIVDMIRNDLTKIANVGSVRADQLFDIETYKTIHQMTSTVTAETDPSLSFSKIIENMFPCASITGAPKKRTIQIIKELESFERSIYTGSIGFISPKNDMCFNVPIRTLINQEKGKATMGLGGGILYESSIEAEYQEVLDKSLFLRKLNEKFHLIESFLYDGSDYKNISQHLARLNSSALFFNFPLDQKAIIDELQELKKAFTGPQKIRLQLFYDGQYKISSQPCNQENSLKKITVSSSPTSSKNTFLLHKTSLRKLYDIEYKQALEKGYYDIIYFNQNKELTEASRHNIFVQIDDQIFTPPLSSGVLAGIERQQWIEQGAQEKVLFFNDLKRADKIYLTNSVRGRVEVQL